FEDAQKYMKEYAHKAYAKKGEAIVQMNYSAIDVGANGLIKVPVDPAWANLADDEQKDEKYIGNSFIENVVKPINAARGDSLPVSAFIGYEDGHFEAGTTAYEKRGVGVMVPKWIEQNCIQCNQCAFVCPHAVIRPFLIDENELSAAPQGVKEHNLE
ncbi:4Fe-4S binding protein, partial [Campylobacter concisus]